MASQRDPTIDVLRGVAVFTMIPANMSAIMYAGKHAFWFRAYTSFAAPLFVLLMGYMVAANSNSRKYDLKYFTVRGLMVLGMAALVDMTVWRVAPFMTFDVLYTIGFSMPLVFLFTRISDGRKKWGITLAIIALTPVLQYLLGYPDYPTEYYLIRKEQISMPANQTHVLQHYFVDGWFPLFPWLAFSFLGALFAELRTRAGPPPSLPRGSFLNGLILLIVGLVVWWNFPGKLLIRTGFSELFYPPTLGYVLTSIGLTVILFVLVDLRPDLTLYQPLRLLGEAALLMYILHLALYQYVFAKIWPKQPVDKFLFIATAFSVGLMILGLGIRKLKTVWTGRPMFVRFLIGG